MPRIRTKRWNDPVEPDDGRRLLVCRYRPRGVRKEAETWDAWLPNLGPSRELHADYYGKHGPPISLGEYRRRYLAEMRGQQRAIATLAARVTAGETITLLCSSACVDPARCHRTLLKELIESHVGLRRAPTLARSRRFSPEGSGKVRRRRSPRARAATDRRGEARRQAPLKAHAP